jgi:hypothetical protein
MSKPYLIGWYYALKAFFKTFYWHKARRNMWIGLVKKKYYWYTTEELLESNKKCLGTLEELGRKAFPNGIPEYEHNYRYNEMEDYYEDEDEYDLLPTKKCLCGREYPDLPLYFNKDDLCLICSQK